MIRVALLAGFWEGLAELLDQPVMFDAAVPIMPPRVSIADEFQIPNPGRDAVCPAITPYPWMLTQIIRHLDGTLVSDGHPDQLYNRLMAVTGAAFRLVWSPEWDGGATNLRHLSDDGLTPLRRAGDALGRALRYLAPTDDPGRLVGAVRTALSQGRPVIGFGIASPDEADLITGYDERVDEVMGWSAFADEPPASPQLERDGRGTFCRKNWGGQCDGILLVGDEVDVPTTAMVVRDAFRTAVTVYNTRQTHHRGVARWTGILAWSAWANQIGQDAVMASLSQWEVAQAFRAHKAAVLTTREARSAAVGFLARAVTHVDDVLSLRTAIQHAVAVTHVMDEVHALIPSVQEFARPRARATVQPLLQEAARHDTSIAVLLESMAVARLNS